MQQPLVSVVISAYNRPEMLTTALESVLNQSFSNLEVIVQDDSSEDGCEAVVSDIRDPRIRFTRNRPSLGTVANLRAGYRKCTGKYFATLNDDDFYAPDYLQTMVSILEANPILSLAFCDHYVVDSKCEILAAESDGFSQRSGRSRLNGGVVPDCFRAALVSTAVPGMFAVFRRSAINLDDFPDEVSSGYDFWMVYLGVRDGGPIYYHPERLTFYRIHEGSQTSSFHEPRKGLRAFEYTEFIYRRLLADRRLARIWPELRKQVSEMRARNGFGSLRLHQRRRALKRFFASMQMRPNRRALAGIALGLMPGFVFQLLNRKS
jgi:glycosyltransferase involved in cell wall biosynthesis